ncbi:ADAMTS-like protein 1 isoform X2 [Hermetia illucens]|uniref:ADAMTS-like protein 1 isoform X2 n=1 Tax=Hermetia illucens TaxID=343691 RepID=UPI0018CBF8EF|nr:ADAMTS-like protein 1 isoform X2 [Hermetia illucens]
MDDRKTIFSTTAAILLITISLVIFSVRTTTAKRLNASEAFDNTWPSENELENELEQKRSKNQAWSAWSDWSTCSRSCDGGIAQQLRRCHSPNGCRGESIRFKICNMQPCPESQDFRAHQCMAYDDVPYDGTLFKWTPHYDYLEPCALTCRGRPAHLPDDETVVETDSADGSESFDEPSVIVQLTNRVQDGTRCRPGSLDMCIQGKCQRVGCDLKIGSAKKVDACGVCGGDGSSCSQPLYHWEMAAMSLCSVTCGGGYKMSRPKCRNRVTGEDVEDSLCSAVVQPEPAIVKCNTHLCPARWIVEEWGPCTKSCGGGYRERAVVCAEESNGVKSKIPDDICRTPKPPTRESCNLHECPKWVPTEWSGCSVSCGTGIQVRGVECMDSHGKLSTQCNPHTKPPAEQVCTTGISCEHSLYDVEDTSHSEEENSDQVSYNDQPYYSHWQSQAAHHEEMPPLSERRPMSEQKSSSEPSFMKETEWSPCNATCGEGYRTRKYVCKILLEFSKTLATLNDSLCEGPKPPDEIERCIVEPCSLAFGYDESYPKDSIRVGVSEPGKTYVWREQGYTSCSASCLGGVEELIIQCVREDTGKGVSPYLCSPETKPEARVRTCNDRPCPPRWNYSDFTPCSKSCGIGIRTREVTCIHEVTRGGENTMVVPNTMCPQPPPADRQYCNVLDCPVRWEVSEWSKCSQSCGYGIKERRVECKQIMAQEHKIERPESMCPSARPPDKKPCNVKPCPPEDPRPTISVSNSTYIQHDPKKTKITLKIGGAAEVFFGTQVKIKCPVKRYNRTKIRWSKDHKFLTKSKKIKISKKGALRILGITFRDAGVYMCHAGLSTAEINIDVKPKPGGVQPDVDYSNLKEDSDRSVRDRSGTEFLTSADNTEKSTTNSRKKLRERSRNRQKPDGMQHADSSIMDDEYLWPLQSFSNSPGHHVLIEKGLDFGIELEQLEKDEPVKAFNISDIFSTTTEDAVLLGRGDKKDLQFEWMTTPWSECSQTCGLEEGLRRRSIYCMVKLHNTTQSVDNALCEDAGLEIPDAFESCGQEECPRWVIGSWTLCQRSRCIGRNTAIQKRDIVCRFPNDTHSNKCDEGERPLDRQECYNELCKGVWRVEPWSQCNAQCGSQGIKYRILQCVWYGTRRPAGNACRNQPRPAVMKVCKGAPCMSNLSECKDTSRYCRNVRSMGLCRLHRYQQKCCKSCKFNIYN